MNDRDLLLTKSDQHRIRKLLGSAHTISEYLGKAAEQLKKGEGLVKAFTDAAPWLKDAGEAVGEAIPIVNIVVKLAAKWLEQTHPYELGAVACTLAYQQAVAKSIEKLWLSATNYSDAKKIDDHVSDRIRDLPSVEAADLSTFTRSSALQHEFVRRADAIFDELLRSAGVDADLRRKILDAAHDAFLDNLHLLLSNKKTAEKFAPFKDWMDLDSGRKAALAALQVHAKYQRYQYESEPIFKREPYALKHIYVDTECGKLTWKEIRGSRGPRHAQPSPDDQMGCDPFSENHGERHDLLQTVLAFIADKTFNEPIVIQGVAGAGKSSFTLRLCAELWEQGFHPIRIRLKRLHLSDSLIDALNKAIELANEDQIARLRIDRPDDLLLQGAVFKTPHGGDHSLSRYVVILDGWDELDLSDSKTFREKVGEMLREVRRELLDPQRMPRVRVVVTGRPSPDVVESKFLNDATPVLTMRPIRPEQLRKFVANLDDALGMTPPYLQVENPESWRVPALSLQEVFDTYEAAFTNSLLQPEEAGHLNRVRATSDAGALEVLGLPLLAYLTIRVLADLVKDGGPLEQQQAIVSQLINNPTLLYRRLIDLTCEKAGKAAVDQRDGPSELERQAREVGFQLRERLRRTAAAMSVLGAESISRDEWSRRVPGDQDSEIEQKTQAAEDHPLARLMISFYFKGGQPEQGCEFAHKSFREYLFAECIVETLKQHATGWKERDLAHAPSRRHWRDFSEDDPRRKFSRDLAELLAPQWLTPNVLNHLRELVRLEIDHSVPRSISPGPQGFSVGLQPARLGLGRWKLIRDTLADLWEWWTDGAHLRPQIGLAEAGRSSIQPPFAQNLIRWGARLTAREDHSLELETITSIDAHLAEGLCELCALTHFHVAVAEGWRGICQPKEPGHRSRAFQWVGELGSFVFFAPTSATEQQNLTFKKCIARVNAAFGRPNGQFPSAAFLAGVNLDHAMLDGEQFDHAILNSVRLNYAQLEGASLSYVSLANASLAAATLGNANLFGARLDNANLDVASLEGAVLVEASLTRASLKEAKLSGANLERASLRESCLELAACGRANLCNADLTRANLRGADLWDAILEDSNLQGVDLGGVEGLVREQLEYAIINESTLLPEGLTDLESVILKSQRQPRDG